MNAKYNFSNHSMLASAAAIWNEAPSVLLREHYRCHPKIAEFFNQKFYNGELIVMTEDHGEKDVLALYRTVPGNHARGHLNQRQIDVIREEVLPALTQKGHQDIGIITPYRDQVAAVVDQLAGSVADTTKSVSSQVAAGAAVSASKSVAEQAAVTAAESAAKQAAVSTAEQVAKQAAYQGASSAAGQAAVSAAEAAKQTVASSITAKQDNGYSLVTGAQALAAGTQQLQDSIPELTQGISLLNNGAQTLTANNAALVGGASTLASGTSQIVDGVSQLDEGSHTLADGIVEFNEEGIEKIVNAYNGDVKDIVNRLQDVLDAGEAYQSYTEVADGVNGSVKFV